MTVMVPYAKTLPPQEGEEHWCDMTLFQMKKLGVVVGKALCAYKKLEIEVTAPILEGSSIGSWLSAIVLYC
jgi:hypothetical protein